MSFWNYRGRCIGRVIHFLYHYAGMDVAEHATIGAGLVEYRGKPFAKYTWSDRFGRCDVPEFTFLDDADGRLAAAQETKAERAIGDGCAWEVPPEGRVHVEAAALRAIQHGAWSSAYVYFGMVHNTDADYFVHGNRLFAEARGWIYAWLPDAKNWMLWVEGERAARPIAADGSEAVQS